MSDQSAFTAALLDTQLPCPPGLRCRSGADPGSRFAVYRNNVHNSLINALADSYPVVLQLVGDTFFRAMAGLYVRHSPPSHVLINDYGRDFADFIQGFAPAATVPYLADMARLERLRIDAYHADDACAVERTQIAAAMSVPSTLAHLQIHLHPSLFTLRSAYAVVSVWTAHQHSTAPQQLAPYQEENALVLRNGLHVEVFLVDSGLLVFINHLKSGLALGQALVRTLEVATDFNLPLSLTLLINHNAITHLQQQDKA
ncbi:Putative DNA-binding domain-containing protein [Pseudomonas sp. ok272]|uniref:HvfC/BufC N-terminal domain-containing protein n=1 Tax=unclassified Pseudomonas TaxID=196821 RepID=UPI0008CDBDE7|nr:MULTISPECIES: DNA-binding domain-containing protein [unclassified Pseudomonas]SEM36268.1 Putative DNA-binding domain-containing protein [Pseudomonas sp. ok272]SFM36652.1 Putative DNA-binding domain-containing protein [Pseudomonas sp. ok602]